MTVVGYIIFLTNKVVKIKEINNIKYTIKGLRNKQQSKLSNVKKS